MIVLILSLESLEFNFHTGCTAPNKGLNIWHEHTKQRKTSTTDIRGETTRNLFAKLISEMPSNSKGTFAKGKSDKGEKLPQLLAKQ